MKTLKATGPLLIQVNTETMPGVPKRKVHVTCVRYETYEIDAAEFDKMTFQMHDASAPEAKVIARLVNS